MPENQVNVLTHGLGKHTVGDPMPVKHPALRRMDPSACACIAAVKSALESGTTSWQAIVEEVGVLVCTLTSTSSALGEISTGTGAEQVSPLRFVAANPASITGAICTAFGLRGPNLQLNIPRSNHSDLLSVVVETWLTSGTAEIVALVFVDYLNHSTASAHAFIVDIKHVAFAERTASTSNWLNDIHLSITNE